VSPFSSLDKSPNGREVHDVLPAGSLRLSWGHDKNCSVLFRRAHAASSSSSLPSSPDSFVVLEGIPATKFSTHDKIRLAVLHANNEFPLCQPICLLCGSNQLVASCSAASHSNCSAPALCGEHYSVMLYGKNAYSGMTHQGSTFTIDICSKIQQNPALLSGPGPVIPLNHYIIRPLIVIVVDCFEAREANRETVHSAITAFFQQNNLIPGLGVLPLELRGTDAATLTAKIEALRLTLSVLFSHAPFWQTVPILVFWNIHFDGLNLFRMGGPEVADASLLRSLIHRLHMAVTQQRSLPGRSTAPAVKYFLNTCGVGRETVESIAQPPDLPNIRLDITSFEAVIPVERVFSVYTAYLRCEVFNLFGFKGRSNALAPFSTVFRKCFAEMDILHHLPICAETINGQMTIWAPADAFRGIDDLPRDGFLGDARSLKRKLPEEPEQPSYLSPPLSFRATASTPASLPASSSPGSSSSSSSVGDLESKDESSVAAPPAKRPKKRHSARLTLGQVQAQANEVGNPHRSRARIALQNLRQAVILPHPEGQPSPDSSFPIASFLEEVNAYRESNNLPLLRSIYDK
jgi:hypothetical protein